MATPLEIVQNAYAAFGRGDVPALLALCSPDVRWQFVADRAAPYSTTAVGLGQLGEWFGMVAASDDIQVFEPRQFFSGPEHVTIVGHERATMRATGKTIECPWVQVFTVKQGRITAFWGMFDTQTVAAARAA